MVAPRRSRGQRAFSTRLNSMAVASVPITVRPERRDKLVSHRLLRAGRRLLQLQQYVCNGWWIVTISSSAGSLRMYVCKGEHGAWSDRRASRGERAAPVLEWAVDQDSLRPFTSVERSAVCRRSAGAGVWGLLRPKHRDLPVSTGSVRARSDDTRSDRLNHRTATGCVVQSAGERDPTVG